MKTLTAFRAKPFWLLFPVLVVAIIFVCRCSNSKPTPDPLAGFYISALHDINSNKTISDDYQDYIKKLSLKNPDFVGAVGLVAESAPRRKLRPVRHWCGWYSPSISMVPSV
jgi:hypothetical protein